MADLGTSGRPCPTVTHQIRRSGRVLDLVHPADLQRRSDFRCSRGNNIGRVALYDVTFTDSGRSLLGAEGFTAWYKTVEPRLRVALSAAYGPERGREAAAEALAWAWEHLDRLGELRHPVPYLFRVGRSRTRLRRIRVSPGTNGWSEPWVEPGLAHALASLTQRQRVAVMLICGHEWTLAEVADLLGVKVTTVQNHMERGLAKLRANLEVSPDE